MSPLGFHLFCTSVVLGIIKLKHAAAFQYGKGMLFERKSAYDEILSIDESFFLQNFTSVDRIHCCINCKIDQPSCVGVLYNREQMKCKLLNRYLSVAEKLGNISHKEWEYLTITKDPYGVAECKRTTLGWDYSGKTNVTKTGRTCQVWASQSPHSHHTGTNLPENYCRNPDVEPAPWCYTTDPMKRWEICDIPMCDTPPLDCITSNDPTGLSYFGKQNVANTGDQCQRWDSQTPHNHTKDELADQGNFCRNPYGEADVPWCYTVNPNKRWSECIIPRC